MTPAHLLPLPPGFPPRHRPADALTPWPAHIPEPGRFYICSDGVLGVLSLPSVSVWSNGRVLWWATPDGEVTWPAADAPGAARRLSRADDEADEADRTTGLKRAGAP